MKAKPLVELLCNLEDYFYDSMFSFSMDQGLTRECYILSDQAHLNIAQYRISYTKPTLSFAHLVLHIASIVSDAAGNTKGGSITVPLTSCLTGFD